MATVTGGTLSTTAKNAMADSIGELPSLTLQAWSPADPTSTLLDSAVPTFSAASGGQIDLASNVTFTLTAGETVDRVRLFNGGVEYASITLTTDNAFPAGGSLIVENYTITVS
jgi:hypothetical protein